MAADSGAMSRGKRGLPRRGCDQMKSLIAALIGSRPSGGNAPPPTPPAGIDLNPARGTTTGGSGFAGGRIPRFIVDAQWITDMNAAITAGEAWAASVAANAALTGTAGERYGDIGAYATTMYQATGSSTYSAKGITKLTAALAYDVKAANNGNAARSGLHAYVIMYDHLYAAMTSQQKTDLMARLYYWAEYCVAQNVPNQYTGGMRLADSDALTAYYMGLALLDCLDMSENTLRGTWLAVTNPGPASGCPAVGGIDATGANSATVRNRLSYFLTVLASGGEWFESSEYNPETIGYLVWSYYALKTAMLTDHFPEITNWLPLAGYWAIQRMSNAPGFVTPFNIGDNELDGDWRRYYAMETAGALAGILTRLSDPAAPTVVKYAKTLCSLYPTKTTGTGLTGRAAWGAYNPLATAASDFSNVPADVACYYGMRNVQLTSDLRVMMFAPQPCGVDHAVEHTLYSLVWCNNEMVVNQPTTYTGTPHAGVASGLVLCGLRGQVSRNVVRDEGSVALGWVARTAETHGQFGSVGAYQPPPQFATVESREVHFMEAGWGIRISRHSGTVLDPTTLANFIHYNYGYDWRVPINAALSRNGRMEQAYHAPVAPTDHTTYFSWTTAGGREVRVYPLVGVAGTDQYNESVTADATIVFDVASVVSAVQKKYQARVRGLNQDAQAMLNVQMWEITPGAGSPPAISGATIDGVTIGSKVVTFDPSSTSVA